MPTGSRLAGRSSLSALLGIGLYREQDKLDLQGLHLNRLPETCPDDPAVQELEQEMNL